MKPEDCKVGMRVLYEPSPGRRFEGTVCTKPQQLMPGTWVTFLTKMEPAYGRFKGMPNCEHVSAANLERIEPVLTLFP